METEPLNIKFPPIIKPCCVRNWIGYFPYEFCQFWQYFCPEILKIFHKKTQWIYLPKNVTQEILVHVVFVISFKIVLKSVWNLLKKATKHLKGVLSIVPCWIVNRNLMSLLVPSKQSNNISNLDNYLHVFIKENVTNI